MERTLDPAGSYVTTTGGRYAGHDLVANHPITIVEEPSGPGQLTTEQGQQLLDARKIQLAADVRPTPVEKPEDAVRRLAVLERIEGDEFLLRAPWLPKAETISGEDKAHERLAEVRDLGIETYRSIEADAAKSTSPIVASDVAGAAITGGDGFSVEETGSNGYYTVVAPGREPEKVRGKANADKRLADLRIEIAAEQEQAAALAGDGTSGEVPDEDDEA